MDKELEEFKENLEKGVLLGRIVAMVEERLFAIKYEESIFIVASPLEGFYVMNPRFTTLKDYIDYNNIKSVNDFYENGIVYDEKLMIREFMITSK
ncbi:hypothetical protein D3C81_1343010 [compost metagenome]